jgi:hypothetical protein
MSRLLSPQRVAAIGCMMLILVISTAVAGCSRPTVPVTFIEVFRVRPGESAAPPPSWTALAPTNPFPAGVQGVLGPREKIFFGLIINKDAKEPVTFSGYTYYRETPAVTTEVPLRAGEMGPFNPGQTPLVGMKNPWPVPSEPGIYQLRVYLGGKVVASAIFEVSAEDQ